MHILVTGGLGFLGSHLTEALLKEGHQVTCLDNLDTGNWLNLLPQKNLQLVRGDVRDRIKIKDKFDVIYNLAALASPVAYGMDPIGAFNTNVQGTQNVLELARCTGACVIQASSSDVYGNEPGTDEMGWGRVNLIGPRSCYAESKRAAETLCSLYNSRRLVCVKIVRIFNSYGPNMRPDDGRVIPAFINSLIERSSLEVHGGSQTRCFCYVTDIIEGLRLVLHNNFEGPINIGSTESISIWDLALKLQELMQVHLPWDISERAQDDPLDRLPNIQKAKAVLGWEPKVSLHDGLLKTIEYFKSTTRCPPSSP